MQQIEDLRAQLVQWRKSARLELRVHKKSVQNCIHTSNDLAAMENLMEFRAVARVVATLNAVLDMLPTHEATPKT